MRGHGEMRRWLGWRCRWCSAPAGARDVMSGADRGFFSAIFMGSAGMIFSTFLSCDGERSSVCSHEKVHIYCSESSRWCLVRKRFSCSIYIQQFTGKTLKFTSFNNEDHYLYKQWCPMLKKSKAINRKFTYALREIQKDSPPK